MFGGLIDCVKKSAHLSVGFQGNDRYHANTTKNDVSFSEYKVKNLNTEILVFRKGCINIL